MLIIRKYLIGVWYNSETIGMISVLFLLLSNGHFLNLPNGSSNDLAE